MSGSAGSNVRNPLRLHLEPGNMGPFDELERQSLDTTTQKSSEPYKYQSLNQESQQVRLLDLLPAKDAEEKILCSLATVTIDEHPSYEALSYSWGPKGDVCNDPIYIDGHEMIVSRSLESALRALRLLKLSRTLWIDALCINQNDMEERASQVTMMDSIYSKAKRVVVWLGEPSADSALAMSALATMTSKKNLERLSPEAYQAIEKLVARPFSWFSRVWVVQEFSLARGVVFLCGQQPLEWAGLEEFLASIVPMSRVSSMSQQSESNTYTEMVDLLPRSEVWTRLLMERRGIMAPAHGRHLVDKKMSALLASHIKLDVTDPHDRIYGFLGIAAKYGLSFSAKLKKRVKERFGSALGFTSISTPLPPPLVDYTKPVNEVLIEWAKWMIESEKSLSILFTHQLTTPEPTLPSWAPSWKARAEATLVPKFSEAMVLFHASSALSRPPDTIRIGTSLLANFSFSPNQRELSVTGVHISTFEPSSYTFGAVEPGYERRLFKYFPSGYLSGLDDASFGDHYLNYAAHHRVARDHPIMPYTLYKEYKATSEKTPARIQRLRSVVETNRVQYTGVGGESGLVPKETRHGDLLVLFQSVETPFVIRPVEDGKCVLIGEAFAEGCMEGEKRAWERGKKGTKTTFVLV